MDAIINNSDNVLKSNILKKLNKLYNGQIYLKGEVNSFVNLSNYELSTDEKDILNLGLNYHIKNKYNELEKSVEKECLY